MRIKVISFTKTGMELSVNLKERLTGVLYKRNRVAPSEDIYCKLFTACKSAESLPPHVTYTNEAVTEFAEDGFRHYDAILFIGACGIAVRAIAPCVKDKFQDVPVLVMDELSGVIIPILSGHLGGANRLAEVIAKEMDLQAVITTATDLHKKFAVDLFAADNDLSIVNREGIAAVSAKILSGEDVLVSVDKNAYAENDIPVKQLKLIPYEENRSADILITSDVTRTNGAIILRPKEYVLGIGCKRGTSFEKIEKFVKEVFAQNGLDENLICAAASVDLKKKEDGIHQFSKKHRIPFVLFSAEELEKVKGDFRSSDFVKETVGVDNVCERSAMAAAGENAELILEKTSGDGITVSVAKRKCRIYFTVPEEMSRGMAVHDSKNEVSHGTEERPRNGENSLKNHIYVIGIGPGDEAQMTNLALSALEKSDVIVGYPVYIDLLPDRFKTRKLRSTPMRQERDRCILAFEEASKGQCVSMICSGDAGIYGMAGLIYETGVEYPETEIEIIPGVTAASSGAALLGAPLNHDFCVISLSDLLTPWEQIEARLKAAAEGDFAIAIYNPSSKKRKDHLKRACEILLRYMEPSRPCGYVRNIGRENEEAVYLSLAELKETETDMFTTVFIGNSGTEMIGGKLVTKRGYRI